MFGSVVLEVAVGLIFIFLLVSLVCSALREAVEARLRTRAVHLERGLRELLDDANGTALAKRVYEHPLIYSLFKGEYRSPAQPVAKDGATGQGPAAFLLDDPRYERLGWVWHTIVSWFRPATELPSYIPSRQFALALMDLAARGDVGNEAAPAPAPLTIDAVRTRLSTLGNPRVERALLTALDTAGGDMEAALRNVETWFDGSMDRVSGWYKRETQHIVFWLGLVVAIALNIDTVSVVRHLAMSPAARQSLISQAEVMVKQTPPRAGGSVDAAHAAEGELDALGEKLLSLHLPIGWGDTRLGTPKAAACSAQAGASVRCTLWPYPIWLLLPTALGWLLTAFAVSLGAPFWFDLLNKIMVIRSTVKPHEKSPEEGSEDRPPVQNGATADDKATHSKS